MTADARIILASASAIRAAILRGAGVPFEVINPAIDEEAIKRQYHAKGESFEAMAMALAEAKALAVPAQGDALVIGADQILAFRGEAFDKPASLKGARTRLLDMQGKTHTLINAVSVARAGSVGWRHLDRAKLFMREMHLREIDAYLAAAGDDVLASVGAYQMEKLGSRIISRIEGDYFAVLGLSLYPLLGFLRREGALAF